MKNFIEEYGTVVHEQDQNLVSICCKGYIPYENLVDIAEYGYSMIVFYKADACLINMLEMKIYPFAFEEYLRNTWYAKIRAAGINRIAFIVPENIFGKISMEHVHSSEDVKKIERQYFTDEQSGRAWLSHIPEAASQAVLSH